MDTSEKINSGNNLRDGRSGYGMNYGEVFRYWDWSFARFVETDDKEDGKKRKVSKVRLQKFLIEQVGSSDKPVDVEFYCAWHNVVSLTHCVMNWTRKIERQLSKVLFS